MFAEEIRTQSVRHANSCLFTMVAVDDEGCPSPVPPLRPVTPDEKRRYQVTLARKQLRQELEQKYNVLRESHE